MSENKRKVILNLCTTLDGFIEGPKGEIDWCFTDQDYSMTEFLANTDCILFGRKSYEQFLSMDPTLFPDKEKIVFSLSGKDRQDVTVINGNIAEEIENLKSRPGKNLWLFGGASLTSAFLNLDLIDEFMISVHPLILGSGKPLFEKISERKQLLLTNVKSFSSGLVQLYYERIP